MFDFQKLSVYQKAKAFAKTAYQLIQEKKYDRSTCDQLRRASFSIMLNISESASRFSKKDRKNFLIIARGSVYECVAILEFLKEVGALEEECFKTMFQRLEELSKMLYGLIGRTG